MKKREKRIDTMNATFLFTMKNKLWYITLAVIGLGLGEKKLVLYVEFQQFSKRQMKLAQIVKHLKDTRGTVYTYLNMSFNEIIIKR